MFPLVMAHRSYSNSRLIQQQLNFWFQLINLFICRYWLMVDTAEVVAGVKHCTGLMYTDSYILECVPLLISSI